MGAVLQPNDEVRMAVAGAYGASVRIGAIGTEHLLVGLGHSKTGRAGSVLAATQLTTPVTMAVLRRRGPGRSHAWRSDDGAAEQAEPAAGPGWFQTARKPLAFTAAARVALHRAAALAQEQDSATIDQDHLLRALLTTGENRATELVRECGVDPASLVDMLTGLTPVPHVEDPVAPELRPTRDALFHKGSYHSGCLGGRAVNAIVRIWPVAEAATAWVRIEAPEQARRLGMTQTGTEHVVLAILAVHETLQAYPQMRPERAAPGWHGSGPLARTAR